MILSTRVDKAPVWTRNLSPEMLKRSIIIGLFFCLIIIPCLAYNDWAATIYSDGGEGTAGVNYIGGGSLFARVEYNNDYPPLYFHHYVLVISDCGTTIGTWDMGTSATHSPQLHIELNAIEQSDNSLLVYYTIEGAKTASGTWTAHYNYRPNYDPVEFELSGWTCDYSGVNPTPSPTPTPTPDPCPDFHISLLENSTCSNSKILLEAVNGTGEWRYHIKVLENRKWRWEGNAVGDNTYIFRLPTKPNASYEMLAQADQGNDTRQCTFKWTGPVCTTNGTINPTNTIPSIAPTGGWPTHGPTDTRPIPIYTTAPTGTRTNPTIGPTGTPWDLPIIPTTMVPIWDPDDPVPIPSTTPGFWSPPKDIPDNPVVIIINETRTIIDVIINYPDDLNDIINYPNSTDLLNLVNSSIITDDMLLSYFSIWDRILDPFIEAWEFVKGILEMPADLIQKVLDYLIDILKGVFNEVFNLLKGAEFFTRWIFYIVPEPFLWIALAVLVLALITKVLRS